MRRAAEVAPWVRSFRRAPTLLTAVLFALGALLYGASPIDVIPEILAGPLGLGDDAVVLVAAGVAIHRLVRSRALRRRSALRRPRPEPPRPANSWRGPNRHSTVG